MLGSRVGVGLHTPPPPWKIQNFYIYIIKLPKICIGPPGKLNIGRTPPPTLEKKSGSCSVWTRLTVNANQACMYSLGHSEFYILSEEIKLKTKTEMQLKQFFIS